MPVSGQTYVELTNVFEGVVNTVPWKKRLDLGRDSRKSRSDLLVEEDLANVFGRETRIISLHPTSTITFKVGDLFSKAFDSGPGPTFARAIGKDGRRNLSTVIQLSFFGSLVECMNKVLSDGIEDNSVTRFEDVVRTLEACTSQTSEFEYFMAAADFTEKKDQSEKCHSAYFRLVWTTYLSASNFPKTESCFEI
ncbi:hypothetical protein HYFRA_00004783 [Hymenoscyphus fraxineus]|uniref:Uncharacterized protein n=1 Tax=Hymenoscyphus fraxineus TaxID=746836 RepID=A0A9N9PJX3_9HELO|nr:hypothetical protein HYFRA_00004783 [Hymenoscyphus fraxineus]